MKEDYIKEVFDKATRTYMNEVRLALQMCRDAQRGLVLMNLDNKETLHKFHEDRKLLLEAYLKSLEELAGKGFLDFNDWFESHSMTGMKEIWKLWNENNENNK